MSTEWMASALCAQIDCGDIFFPGKGESADPARRICGMCDVQPECLDYALYRNVDGVWGGMSENQRAKHRTRLGVRLLSGQIRCGTEAGARAHNRRGEKACPPCLEAQRSAQRERVRRRASGCAGQLSRSCRWDSWRALSRGWRHAPRIARPSHRITSRTFNEVPGVPAACVTESGRAQHCPPPRQSLAVVPHQRPSHHHLRRGGAVKNAFDCVHCGHPNYRHTVKRWPQIAKACGDCPCGAYEPNYRKAKEN